MIEITLLGTGSPLVDPLRAGPGHPRAGGRRHAPVRLRPGCPDAGGGRRRCTANQLTALVLTHLHSDHITDLNDVITSRWVTTFAPIAAPRHRAARDAAPWSTGCSRRWPRTSPTAWPTTTTSPGTRRSRSRSTSTGSCSTRGACGSIAAPTDHRPVDPSVGYRVEHDGHAVVIAGDTVPCEGLDRLCAGADALVHTVIRADLVRRDPGARACRTSSTTTRRWSRRRRPRRATAWARSCSRTTCRRCCRARRRSGATSPPPTSTDRSSWATTSTWCVSAP